MKLPSLTIKILTLCTILFISFAMQKAWHVYESTEHGYRILFPDEPVTQRQEIDSEIGKLQMNYVMLQDSSLDADNLVYMVDHTVYPEDKMHSSNEEQTSVFFERAVKNAVINVNGKLLSEVDIWLGRFPGKEITIKGRKPKEYIKMRVYIVNNSAYILQVTAKKAKKNNPSMDRFLNSFKLFK